MSTPTFDPDDPRLTAYALGESTAAERQAVDQLLEASPEAHGAVGEIQALARRLEEDFARENAAYQATLPRTEAATNVIPFPTPRRRFGSFVAAAWKAAAVVVALAVALPFILRRTPPPPVATLETPAPRVASAPAPQVSEAAPTPAETPKAPEEDKLLAANSDQDARAGAAKAEPPADAVARPSLRRDAEAQPGTLRPAPPASAPAVAATAPAQDAPPAPAVVRLRLEDGSFLGGVLLGGDGWLLTTRKLSAIRNPARATVVLADGREFPVAMVGNVEGFGLGLLRVKAAALPAATLAAEPPEDGDPLIVAHIDEHTGAASFARARAGRVGGHVSAIGAAGEGDFVFNAAGQLLASERTPPAAKSADRARAAVRREEAGSLLIRAFTASERATLTHLPK